MADKKPDPKKAGGAKPASSASSEHIFALEIKIFSVIAFIALIYFATGRYVLEKMGYSQVNTANYFSGTILSGFDLFNYIFNLVIFFSVFLILLFALGAFYLKQKQKETVLSYKTSLPKGYIASLSVTAREKTSSLNIVNAGSNVSQGTDAVNNESIKPVLNVNGDNKKWEDIQKHMASMSSSDWRMAILEADILLYEMLDQMGYDGDTIAEKLKKVESSDFNTLDLAWRAHKVRNAISHEGSDYELSHQQAQNTIELYQKVFEEFYFV